MPDVWAAVGQLDAATQRGLADVAFPARARVLEVGFDSTLSHVPDPARALAEAARVLRPSGWLAAFDGDYATTTVALGDQDPLQPCVEAMMASSVHDRFLVRRLPGLVRGCGLELAGFRGHGYIETGGGYLLAIVGRGGDVLLAAGQLGEEAAGR